MLKTYPETLKYNFKNINGSLGIEFEIKVKKNFFKTEIVNSEKNIDYHDLLLTMRINLHLIISTDNNKSVEIILEKKNFLQKFENFYKKFIPGLEKQKIKYFKNYEEIGKSHLKTLNTNIDTRIVVDKYIKGYLMGIYDGEKINLKKKPVNNFVLKLDMYEDRFRNSIDILKKLENSFKEFKLYNKKFVVWRGSNFKNDFKEGKILKNQIPFSTSLYPYVARSFLHEHCCLIKINVPKNFPCIFVHRYQPWEKEVILSKCKLKVIKVLDILRDELYSYLGDDDIPYIPPWIDYVDLSKEIKILECEIVD